MNIPSPRHLLQNLLTDFEEIFLDPDRHQRDSDVNKQAAIDGHKHDFHLREDPDDLSHISKLSSLPQNIGKTQFKRLDKVIEQQKVLKEHEQQKDMLVADQLPHRPHFLL